MKDRGLLMVGWLLECWGVKVSFRGNVLIEGGEVFVGLLGTEGWWKRKEPRNLGHG